MRRVVIAVVCVVLTACCVAGVLLLRVFHFGGSSGSTPAEAVFRTNQDSSLSIAKGDCTVLAISAADEKALNRWQSSDPKVVSVDSGGRIDARKEGSAVVTASFSDGHVYTYRLTVTKAEKAPQADLFSTAITANADIEAKNRKNNPPPPTESPTEDVDDGDGFDEFYDDDGDDDYYYYYDEYDEDFDDMAKTREPAKSSETYRPLYEVQVNRLQNCVTVFTYDDEGKYTVPVRAMVCSCGKDGRTITGEYTIYFHTEWHPLVEGVFGQYISGFSGDFLFHSVPYEDLAKNTLETDEFNKLGEAASKGCVRLAVADARWIYENCAEGTTVKIFDSEEPLPLGKPAAIRLADKTVGWDPTDHAEENPYNGKLPTISGAEDKTVSVGSDYNMTDGVKAANSCGADITGDLEIIGNVVPSRAGVYQVTYKITDALHRSAQKEITVTVKG